MSTLAIDSFIDGLQSPGEEGEWREDPVDFDTFVRSPEHLGLPALYPRQREFVKRMLGDDPKLIFADPEQTPDNLRRAYQGAVALWGKGAGKDYLCSIVVCYLIHVLLCLRDPQEYLELAPGEPIDIVNVAYNADQAKKVFFAKLKARIERWKWLAENFNLVEAGRRKNGHRIGLPTVQINDDHIEFPHRLRAWSRHAQNESYEGLNVIAWLMDEASAFLSQAKRENAEAIFQTLKTSAASRFGLRWLGFIISYPRHADDFTCTQLREAQSYPDRGFYGDGPAKTWEINERTRNEPRVKVRDVEVPFSLANDFHADFEEALSRYCCEPPLARDAFFRFPQRIHDAIVKDRVPAVEWEPVVITREQGDGTMRRLRGVKLTQTRELPPGTKLYMHGDPGLTDDSFALALGYATPATVMMTLPAAEVLDAAQLELRELGPEDPVDWERDVVKTVVVALIVWKPDKRTGMQVDLQNVEDTILEMKRVYPSIGHWPRKRRGESKPRPTLTTDHWNSALTIQRMSGRRMNVKDEAWTRDFQLDIYRNARSNIYNGLVELPDTPSVTSADPAHPGAVYELERIELIDGCKIDHPEGGSKDEADSVVRVIQHATEHSATPNMGMGSAYGHSSMYPQTAPMVPVPEKTVDPERTETIGDRLRVQEQQRQAMRPPGELVPADGTIDGKRMGFGSIRSR